MRCTVPPVTAAEVFAALERGDAERLRSVVAADPSLGSARNEEGVSAVREALYSGNDELAEVLVQAGAELDVFDAAAVGDVRRLRELIDADSSLVDAYSSDGFTPLQLASFFSHPEAVDVLLERGADVSSRSHNDMGVMPLHAAAAARNAGIVRALLAHGADPNVRQEGSFTPLHEAALHGHEEMVELLLEHGADPRLRTNEDKDAADVAEERGHRELAARLRAVV